MRDRIVVLVCLWLCGCASRLPSSPAIPREPVSEKKASAPDLAKLQNLLGLERSAEDLGFTEKDFDGCKMGVKGEGGKCGPRFFTVVNFRLLCRDTEETVAVVANNLTPLNTDRVQWKLAGATGFTRTDAQGYGTVQVVTEDSTKAQRLVLIVGKQFLGLEISQVGRIVVPVYWCSQL